MPRVTAIIAIVTLVVACSEDVPLGGVDASSVDAPSVDAPSTFTVAVAVDTVGASDGIVVSSPPGIDCGADCAHDFAAGTTVTLVASPNAGSTFVGWSGGGCNGTGACTVTAPAATTTTVIANFGPLATLLVSRDGNGSGTVTSNPAGIDCGADCTETYTPGTVVTLLAVPDAGFVFTGWSGGGCAGTGLCQVIVSSDTTVVATFALDDCTVTVIRAGTGTGTVTSSPGGINCGADCTETYASGVFVALTATPAVGSVFTGWSGWSGGVCNGTSVTAIANFTSTACVVSVTKTGSGTGTVTSSPSGISCGADCSEAYGCGTAVILVASTSAGSTFVGWSGGGCTGTGTCTVSATGTTAVTATFAVNTCTLDVIRAGPGIGTIVSAPAGVNCGADCQGSYACGTVVTLSAAPGAGSSFAGWSGAGCTGTGPCSVSMSGPMTVSGTFSTP